MSLTGWILPHYETNETSWNNTESKSNRERGERKERATAAGKYFPALRHWNQLGAKKQEHAESRERRWFTERLEDGNTEQRNRDGGVTLSGTYKATKNVNSKMQHNFYILIIWLPYKVRDVSWVYLSLFTLRKMLHSQSEHVWLKLCGAGFHGGRSYPVWHHWQNVLSAVIYHW